MSYLAVKHLHISFAALSGILFFIRGLLMIGNPAVLGQRWLKIVPHVIDTLLLASALTMVVWSSQYPFVQNWLTAKLIALFVYIGLGMVALRFGRTKQVRIAAFIGAMLVFFYIVKVAMTRQVL